MQGPPMSTDVYVENRIGNRRCFRLSSKISRVARANCSILPWCLILLSRMKTTYPKLRSPLFYSNEMKLKACIVTKNMCVPTVARAFHVPYLTKTYDFVHIQHVMSIHFVGKISWTYDQCENVQTPFMTAVSWNGIN